MYRDDIMNALREIREISKSTNSRLDNIESSIQNIETMMRHLLGSIGNSFSSSTQAKHLAKCGLLGGFGGLDDTYPFDLGI